LAEPVSGDQTSKDKPASLNTWASLMKGFACKQDNQSMGQCCLQW